MIVIVVVINIHYGRLKGVITASIDEFINEWVWEIANISCMQTVHRLYKSGYKEHYKEHSRE